MSENSIFSITDVDDNTRHKNIELKLNIDGNNNIFTELIDITHTEECNINLKIKNLICNDVIIGEKGSTISLNHNEYSSGTDGNLTNPDDNYIQNNCFFPMSGTQEDNQLKFYIGDYYWDAQGITPGPAQAFNFGNNVGTIYGTVKFSAPSANWDTFASSSYNGIQRVYLPRLANNDQLGGYVDFYYHQSAYSTAFNGNQINCIITIDGSSWKGSVDTINYTTLVVDSNGHVGPAGGGTVPSYDIIINLDRNNIINIILDDNNDIQNNITLIDKSYIKGNLNILQGTKVFDNCEKIIINGLINNLSTIGSFDTINE